MNMLPAKRLMMTIRLLQNRLTGSAGYPLKKIQKQGGKNGWRVLQRAYFPPPAPARAHTPPTAKTWLGRNVPRGQLDLTYSLLRCVEM